MKKMRVIYRLRKQYPQFMWKYAPRFNHWVCEVGRVEAVFSMHDPEESASLRLCFYRPGMAPVWVA
jgi:hypothetical protein